MSNCALREAVRVHAECGGKAVSGTGESSIRELLGWSDIVRGDVTSSNDPGPGQLFEM